MDTMTSKNPTEAFFGAMTKIGRAVGKPDLADKTWDMAMKAIYAETREEIDYQPGWVREFLDGEWGQAFAINVISRFPMGVMPNLLTDSQLEDAINQTVREWQSWPMEPKDYRDLGVPEPMRYLDAMVFSAGYYADDEEDEAQTC